MRQSTVKEVSIDDSHSRLTTASTPTGELQSDPRSSECQRKLLKEEVGNDRLTGTPVINECKLPQPLPSLAAMQQSRPIFLVREPVATFDAKKIMNWTDCRASSWHTRTDRKFATNLLESYSGSM